MKNNNIKSTTLSKTLKSLVFALGLGLSVNSCLSWKETNIQNDDRIEFENNDNNDNNQDLENIEPSSSDNNIEKPKPNISNDNQEDLKPNNNQEDLKLNNNQEDLKPNNNQEDLKPNISNKDLEDLEVNKSANKNELNNTDKESNNNNHKHEHKYKEWQYYDTNNEISTCEYCGNAKYRNHKFNNNYRVTYTSNNNGTHNIIKTNKCNNCDYSIENKYDENCNLGSWQYNHNTKLEERNCSICGYKETRTHEHQTTSNLVYKLDKNNGNSTHKLKATYNCSVCGEQIKLYKDVQCNIGSWVYNNKTGLEERNCSVCGYKETKTHEHQTTSNLIYTLDKNNGDGTHKLKATYNCNICNGQITLYKTEPCDYTSWSNSGTDSCVRECKICSHSESKKHSFKVVPNSVTSNATVGLHDVLEKCQNCGYEKTVTVSCTSTGNKYFHQTGNIITERENCALCGDVCIQDPHNHTYGNYISVDDGTHKRTCACGNESIEAHSYSSWLVTDNGTNSRTCSSCNHTETVTHTCSLKDRTESVGNQDCCYVIVTTCEIAGCSYESRVPVSHHFQVESNMFGSIYTCYDCGYSYEETNSLSPFSLRESENENSNNKQLVLR